MVPSKRVSRLKRMVASPRAALTMLSGHKDQRASRLIKYWIASKSGFRKAQFRQDLFVLSELNFKHGGYFVEIGATDGIVGSNTYLLERRFAWKGILAEPAQVWRQELFRNRSAHIDTHCVWKDSNSTLVFNEAENPGLSTIGAFSSADMHKDSRQHGRSSEVTTISLNDLLAKYQAPTDIDYLSIDTEGSEFDILSSFDFSRHTFQVISCEHNYTPMRAKLFDLFTSHGYVRKHEQLSQVDDWYVHPNLV